MKGYDEHYALAFILHEKWNVIKLVTSSFFIRECGQGPKGKQGQGLSVSHYKSIIFREYYTVLLKLEAVMKLLRGKCSLFIESLDLKYKLEHNLSDDEISDFAMLYRDHCEVNKVYKMFIESFCLDFLTLLSIQRLLS